MEGDPAVPFAEVAPAAAACPVCHLPVRPEWYFCPNCGTNLHPAPLSTSLESQLFLYAHSIVLPMLLFLSITRWKGYTYFKSEDSQEKQIGSIAIILLVLSTVVVFWYSYVWTVDYIQQSINSVNADMNF